MKPAPKIDPKSPFGNFAKSMRALLAVSKTELDAEIKKHETKKRRSVSRSPKRRKG